MTLLPATTGTSTMSVLLELILIAMLVLASGAGALRELLDDEPESYTPEHINYLYETGEISLAEMEKREEIVLDEEKMRIFESAQRVGGVGENTAWNIAAAFDTEAEYREANREDYRDVYGVGPELAAALDEKTS
jgi:hypothetical protein